MPEWVTVRFLKSGMDDAHWQYKEGAEERVTQQLASKFVEEGIAEIVDMDSRRIREDSPVTWGQLFGREPQNSGEVLRELGDNSNMSETASQGTLFEIIPENFTQKVYQPSEQQLAVYDWVENGTGHAMVIAVAGSGKTTTLIECFKRIVRTGRKVLFLAFNKKIMKEIRRKVEAAGLNNSGVAIKTFHSHGFGIWMRANRGCKVEGLKVEAGESGYFKFDRIVEELESEIEVKDVNGTRLEKPKYGTMPLFYRTFVQKAWTFARQNLFGVEINVLDKKAWLDLVEHHELDMEIADAAEDMDIQLTPLEIQEHVGLAINWTVHVLRRGIRIANEVIDFEDMIYMPVYANVKIWQEDWVLVDEMQDTNPSRRAFARKILKPTGRTVWVGDPAQAIYGFAGADDRSIETIKQKFNCLEFPLTVSYRCSQAVVRLAQTWMPEIQPHESAPEGQDRMIVAEELLKEGLTADDAILCRNTRPLVSLALALIRKGVACHVEGRNLADGFVGLVRRWKTVTDLDQLRRRLEIYRDRTLQKAMARGREMKADFVVDQVDTMLALISDLPIGSTLETLVTKIEDMFLDSEKQMKPTLTLCTIHRSKGLEWNRVYWLGNNRYNPSKYARQDWQMKQERHLMYVATTRAKDTITRVTVTDENFTLKMAA